jgi:uncharacterized protein (DUF885 family)
VANPTAAIRALADTHAEGMLRLDPLMATMLGDHRYDDRLPDTLTDAGLAATRKLNEDTRAQLARIPRAALSGEDGLTWDVLDDMTRTALDGLAFGDELMPSCRCSARGRACTPSRPSLTTTISWSASTRSTSG